MIEMTGRTISKTVPNEKGVTLLALAKKHNIDWGYNCTRGTCARCRCFVTEGVVELANPTEEELDRLEPEEIEQGFRLGCQAIVKGEGSVVVANKPYF